MIIAVIIAVITDIQTRLLTFPKNFLHPRFRLVFRPNDAVSYERYDNVVNAVIADSLRSQNGDIARLDLVGAGLFGDEIADARSEAVFGDLPGDRVVPNHALVSVDVHQPRSPRDPVQRAAKIVLWRVLYQPT